MDLLWYCPCCTCTWDEEDLSEDIDTGELYCPVCGEDNLEEVDNERD